MSIRQDMLAAARRGPDRLPEPTDELVRFVLAQAGEDGGFRGRGSHSDLYYTVFATECLLAAGREPPAGVREYLAAFGDGEGLDLVHLACLARCWADVAPPGPGPETRRAILGRIDRCRCGDGGYDVRGGRRSSVYGCFLALGAIQDLAGPAPDAGALARCVEACRLPGGGYANQPDAPVATTPTTAAAVVLLRQLGRDVAPASAEWLLARHQPGGGFVPAPGVGAPDLLSTATALHALWSVGSDLAGVCAPCGGFVASLAAGAGGYRGSRADPIGDCEYSFYALLALGHLGGDAAC